MIENGRTNFIGYGPVTTFDLDAWGDDLHGRANIVVENGDFLLTMTNDGEVMRLQGDIFVFALELEELLLFGALTRLNPSFMRHMARGQIPSCFYSAWSRNDLLKMAVVYIPIIILKITSFLVCMKSLSRAWGFSTTLKAHRFSP